MDMLQRLFGSAKSDPVIQTAFATAKLYPPHAVPSCHSAMTASKAERSSRSAGSTRVPSWLTATQPPRSDFGPGPAVNAAAVLRAAAFPFVLIALTNQV